MSASIPKLLSQKVQGKGMDRNEPGKSMPLSQNSYFCKNF